MGWGEFAPRHGGLLEEKIGQGGDEVRVDAGGGGAFVVETGRCCQFAGLGVQVVGNLHVVADETDRGGDHAGDARQLGQAVLDVGFEPGDVRAARTGTVDQLPVETLTQVASAASATREATLMCWVS